VDECKPLLPGEKKALKQRHMAEVRAGRSAGRVGQGLTLVHFSSQLERFVWDRGCA